MFSRMEQLGGTPLNQALLVSQTLVKDFIRKNAVEKMNFVVLSDGDSNGMSETRSYEAKNIERVKTDYFADIHLIVNKKVIKLKDLSRRCTHTLLEDLQKRYNLTTIGFFVSTDNYDFRGKVAEVNNTEYYDSRQQYDEANKMYRNCLLYTSPSPRD